MRYDPSDLRARLPEKYATALIAERLAADLYGYGVEDRVHELRKSILGDECPPRNEIVGLATSLNLPVAVTRPESP